MSEPTMLVKVHVEAGAKHLNTPLEVGEDGDTLRQAAAVESLDSDVWVYASDLPAPPRFDPVQGVPITGYKKNIVAYTAANATEPLTLWGAWTNRPGNLVADLWEEGYHLRDGRPAKACDPAPPG